MHQYYRQQSRHHNVVQSCAHTAKSYEPHLFQPATTETNILCCCLLSCLDTQSTVNEQVCPRMRISPDLASERSPLTGSSVLTPETPVLPSGTATEGGCLGGSFLLTVAISVESASTRSRECVSLLVVEIYSPARCRLNCVIVSHIISPPDPKNPTLTSRTTQDKTRRRGPGSLTKPSVRYLSS